MHWNQYQAALLAALRSVHAPNLHTLLGALNVARTNGATVFTCGNGGSAANASHLAQDLVNGTRNRRLEGVRLSAVGELVPHTIIQGKPDLRALCLCDSIPNITALANDEGYRWVFYQQLVALGRPGDILIAISGSGNSENVLRAVQAAHSLEMHTWGIVGFDGGKLLSLAHRSIHVKCDHMGQVEDVHLMLFHWLTDSLKEALGGTDLETQAGAWCPGVEQ